MENLNGPDNCGSSIALGSKGLSEGDIAYFKDLAQSIAATGSGNCITEVFDGEFDVRRPSRNLNFDPLFGGGSILAFIVTMSLAVDFTPIALVLLVMSFLMPDTSRALAQAIHRKFKKPMMLNSGNVSIHSAEMTWTPESTQLVKHA